MVLVALEYLLVGQLSQLRLSQLLVSSRLVLEVVDTWVLVATVLLVQVPLLVTVGLEALAVAVEVLLPLVELEAQAETAVS